MLFEATSHILVRQPDSSPLIVREGNRRIAALKLAYGHIPINLFDIPEEVEQQISSLSEEWKSANSAIPCAIYSSAENETVDKIVTLIHGKGDKASREKWEAVARARHNRDKLGVVETALDMLEKFLSSAKNITADQKKRWAGSYPITVLDEALKKSAKRFEANTAPELVAGYPAIKYRSRLDEIMKDIGLEQLGFRQLRDSQSDFLVGYGFKPEIKEDASESKGAGTEGKGQTAKGEKPSKDKKGSRATSANDPRSVMKTLRTLSPVGTNRQKIVSLRDEALRLKIDRTPMAFCFLLRSMFEISAKVYCEVHKKDGAPSTVDPKGNEKSLKKLLGEVTQHLTQDSKDRDMVRKLHGAKTELGKPSGILSVASLNQLVHSSSFTTNASDIASVFGNIFPLLQALNE